MKASIAFIGALWALIGCTQPSYEEQRARLIAEIERDIEETSAATGRERLAASVVAAMSSVPRHEFVPASVARKRLRRTARCRSATGRRSRSRTSSR